jgi:N4-gp56 family major capsid protein
MARMTTGTNANLLLDVFHGKLFIDALRETLVVLPLALMEDAPRSSGKQVRWQYFGNPAAATTALAEGADPTTPTDLATTAATATLEEYGAYFEPAKLMLSTAASGTLAEIIKAAAYQAAITLDTLCFTQSLYDLTAAGGGATAAFTADNLRVAYQTLITASAKPHPKTSGGRYFAGVLSPEAMVDLMNEGAITASLTTAATPIWQVVHATDSGVRGIADIPGVGDAKVMWGTELFVSQNVPSEAADQHNNYVIGNECFGAVSIDGDLLNPRVIVTTPEQRVDKPIRNSGTVGWWVAFASNSINTSSGVELLSDIT